MSLFKNLFKGLEKKPKEKPVEMKKAKRTKKPRQTSAALRFTVAGTNLLNDDGKKRFDILDTFAKNHFGGQPFAGASKSKLEDGETFSQYGKLTGIGEVDFEPESKKAIKVILQGYGQIGYVPEDYIDRLNQAMQNSAYILGWTLSGGREKVDGEIVENDYEMIIRILQ